MLTKGEGTKNNDFYTGKGYKTDYKNMNEKDGPENSQLGFTLVVSVYSNNSYLIKSYSTLVWF
jgi:hypothetical protein